MTVTAGFHRLAGARAIAAFLALVLPATSILASELPWILVETTPDGKIFHRESSNPSIPEVMIETEFHFSPAHVYRVVTDYNHFAEFIPHVQASRILLKQGDDQWIFHHLHFPGPVADRAYILKSTSVTSSPGENHFKVSWVLSDRKFPHANLSAGIPPRTFSGYWELSPGPAAGITRARYAITSDPGGWIPGWLVTRHTSRYVRQVAEAVRGRLDGSP